MANATSGGRIVPIVTRPQSSPDLPRGASKSKRNKLLAERECLEIPCLNELGLYALPTEGDGNCLYYALSDQVYGDFNHGEQIRTRLADHMYANKDYFMAFVAAAGGERRAPRRAASSAVRYSSCPSRTSNTPSAKHHEQSFDSKVAQSRQSGVWGGAEEIQAFCQSFLLDVNVYATYGIQHFRDVNASDDDKRGMVHIAFHDFHHYSSVRHKDGPHTGLPRIPQDLKKEKPTSTVSTADMSPKWKVNAIENALCGKHNRETIVCTLQQCQGNMDNAISNLVDGSSNSSRTESVDSTESVAKASLKPLAHTSSRSSSPYSTGSKRSAEDSDSEDTPLVLTRRNRGREQKKRILPDVTVGIATSDDQNDLVSLRLRVNPNAVVEDAVTSASPNSETKKSSVIDRTVVKDNTHGAQKKRTPSYEKLSNSAMSTDGKKFRRSRRSTKTPNPSNGL